MRETRRLVRDAYSTHRSSVSHQTFNFAGEHVDPEQGHGEGPFKPQAEVDEPYAMAEDDEPEVDHPHMRSSMDSERGVSFLGSPMGSFSNIEGELIMFQGLCFLRVSTKRPVAAAHSSVD